ncbi:MAG TPA: ComEC/Rec2 family competence protein, partial [Candidatus Kapabacteria bacterium]|nr:ComEC/Rec2 family competence protein [Candidatus Kapabacteria bacterium]
MKNIRNSPAFKFLVFLLLGFIPSSLFQFKLTLTIIFVFCFIIIALIFYFLSKKYHISSPKIEYKQISNSDTFQDDLSNEKFDFESLCLIISFAFIGMATGLAISYQSRADYMIDSKIVGKEFKGNFNGQAIKILKEAPKYTRILAKGDIRLQNFDELKNQTIQLTIFTNPDDSLKINYGDRITSLIRFKYPQQANLPQEFNEQNYIKYLGADFSATCSAKALHFKSQNFSVSIKHQVLDAINNNISKMFSKNTAGIAKALTIGDHSDISKEMRNAFSVTGTTHILSVSGLHIAIIAGAILWLFSFLKNDWLRFFLVVLSLSAYIYLIDYPASAVRAGLMATLYLLAKTVQRPAIALNIVSTTAVFLLILSPAMALDTGFQMSMGAIIGITIFFEPIKNFFKQFFKKENALNKFVVNSLTMTFSSSAVVSPIVAYYFNIFSIISPLASLVSIPLMVGAQIFALISIVISFIYFPFAQLIANSSQLLIEISEIITSYAAKIPFSHLTSESIFPLSIFISFFLIYLFLSKSKQQIAFRFVVSCVSMLMIIPVFSEKFPSMKYYQREGLSMLQIRRNTQQNDYVIISNIEDTNNIRRDYGLYNFLKKNS